MTLHHLRLILLTLIFSAYYGGMTLLEDSGLTLTAIFFKCEMVFIIAMVASGIIARAIHPYLMGLELMFQNYRETRTLRLTA